MPLVIQAHHLFNYIPYAAKTTGNRRYIPHRSLDFGYCICGTTRQAHKIHYGQVRQIISRGFTPRAINALHDRLAERSESIIKEAVGRGSGNFVEDIAAELPLQAIADLLGVPQEDRKKLFHWSNQMLANEDPDYAEVDGSEAAAEVLMYAMAMAAERKAAPRDAVRQRDRDSDSSKRQDALRELRDSDATHALVPLQIPEDDIADCLDRFREPERHDAGCSGCIKGQRRNGQHFLEQLCLETGSALPLMRQPLAKADRRDTVER